MEPGSCTSISGASSCRSGKGACFLLFLLLLALLLFGEFGDSPTTPRGDGILYIKSPSHRPRASQPANEKLAHSAVTFGSPSGFHSSDLDAIAEGDGDDQKNTTAVEFLIKRPNCRGKERLIKAIISNTTWMSAIDITNDDCKGFPTTWDEVVSPYGVERLVSGFVRAKEVALKICPVACAGKERVLSILFRAGVEDVSEKDCWRLPTWAQVSSLYGEQPVIHGLDTCERYRSVMNRTGIEPRVGVAGLFNTGTNALAQSFNLNFERRDDYQDYYMAGGKHVPPKREWFTTFEWRQFKRWQILPVVLIKDPLWWFQSMCKVHYNAEWEQIGSERSGGHCPNLVPTENEKAVLGNSTIETYEVRVRLHGNHYDRYESLADLWSKWNRLYYDAAYPRLIIRFEDTLFHAEKVVQSISECTGLPLRNARFQYHVEASKKLRSCNDFTSAVAKYGKLDGRHAGLRPLDKQYLQTALDSEILEVFGYQQVPVRDRDDR